MKKIFTIRYRCTIVIALCFCVAACEPEFDAQRAFNVTDSPILFKVSLDRPDTKAMDITTANISSFEATAYPANNTSSAYFSAVTFNGSGSPKVFSSTSGESWPDAALDFYAWAAGSASSQVSKTAYNTFTVTPSTNPSSQVDFVFACAKNHSVSSVTDGVLPLNFRHTESRIAVKVKNTGSKYRFVVSGWKVCYLDNSATFTHNGSSTAGSGLLPASCWSNNSSPSISNYYEQTLSGNVNVAASTSSPVTLDGDMVVIPQTTTKAQRYSSTSAGALPNGSYVAIKVKIIDNATERVIFSDESGNPAWAIWPIAFDWSPGQKYTYSVDLSKGAYYETNPAAGTSDLFAFDNEFVGISVTVGSFTSTEEIILPYSYRFAGLNIASAPLYYNGTNFVIKDDDWNHDSYGSTYGAVNGSYYFNWAQCAGVSGVSYNGDSDWRMPTQAEWAAVTGSRTGSTINGTAGCRYALIQLTGVTYAGNSSPIGLLLAPDGETMMGMSKVFTWNVNSTSGNTGVTAAQLDQYLDAGCVFLPASGYYDDGGWLRAGTYGYYWSSTEYNSTYGYFLSFYSSNVIPSDRNRKASLYFPCRLVRTAD